jgi:hypothetical protein
VVGQKKALKAAIEAPYRTSATHKHFHFCEYISGIIEIGIRRATFQRREKAEFTLECEQ